MKKITFLLFLLTISIGYSQSTHTVDFEPAGVGAGWDWTMDQNGDNPALEFIANPVSGGLNTTATVAKFTARDAGMDWALCITTDDGEFTFDGTNATVKIMVYKTVMSDVAIKFEGSSPAIELKVANTMVNQWEELTFDFSGQIGNTYNKLIIIPDFAARASDNIIYFDNIQMPDGVVVPPSADPATAAPTPTNNSSDVISVYSDTYTSIYTNLNPGWGQGTTMTEIQISGNNTMKYANLDYQGLEYTNPTNVSSMEYIHLDYYTDDATNFDFYLIAGGENSYDIDVEEGITTGEWVSIDIELSSAYAARDLANAFQFKTVGNGTIYLDNLYFWKEPVVTLADATLSDLTVDGVTVDGFSAGTLTYNIELPIGTTDVPTVVGTPTQAVPAVAATTGAGSLPGTSTVLVTAQDLSTTETYTLNFTVAVPTEPVDTPSALTAQSGNVISLFSDSYTDLAATWNPGWGQSTVLTDETIATNAVKKYTNFDFSGIEPTGGTIDASGMTNINFDYWTSDATGLTLRLVDYRGDGAWGGDNIQLDVATATTTGSWNTISILLSEFTAQDVNFILSDIGQLVLVATGASNPVYIDNLYFEYNAVLGVNNYEIEDLTAYPNPTNSSWTISTRNDEITSIEVFNLLGEKVHSIKPNATEVQIDASNLASGIYISKITTASGTSSRKLIKN